jgi:hypothetical protein
VARREEARRKQVKAPAKVYTNEDLRGDTGSAAPAPAPVSQAAAPNTAPPAAPAAGGQPKDDQQAADDAKKTEAYWKDRVAKARADLDRAKTFADALQSRINALTTDFAARSDPAQRARKRSPTFRKKHARPAYPPVGSGKRTPTSPRRRRTPRKN